MTTTRESLHALATMQLIGEEVERLRHERLDLVELGARFMSLCVLAARAGGCTREALAAEFAKSLDRHYGAPT